MTDEQIIKALECCIAETGSGCSECPYTHYYEGCRIRRNNDCIDLINRKDAEIEQRKAEKVKLHTLIPKMLKEAKSEAYKEFAERFKEKASSAVTSCQGYEIYETKQYQISAVGLDNLLKELTRNLHGTCTEGGNEDG